MSWLEGLASDTSQWSSFQAVSAADGTHLPIVQPPEELLSLARKFALDVNPRMVLSRGEAVDLLVKSETTNYLDFKTLEGLFVVYDDGAAAVPVADTTQSDVRIQKVPASKADVFQHSMGPLDKRRLMKFIQVRLSHVQGVIALLTMRTM